MKLIFWLLCAAFGYGVWETLPFFRPFLLLCWGLMAAILLGFALLWLCVVVTEWWDRITGSAAPSSTMPPAP